MHILFVHQNYPAQFGHIAQHLTQNKDHHCTYISEKPPGKQGRIERIQYKIKGGATVKSHYCSRTFENATWHSHAVYEAMKARPDIKPDLVVGHSGFGSTLFLRELYDCPIINYFEYFYRANDSDMDFRPDFPTEEMSRLRSQTRNGMIMLDLENCDAAYSPTHYQRSLFPEPYQPKLQTIFDGIDTDLWRHHENLPRQIAGHAIPDEMKIVTYVARGFESMRGFDIFMKAAKRICDERSDVIFVVVGEDRSCYGGDEKVTGTKSFKEWVLSQDDYDLSRFIFTGRLSQLDLAKLFTLSDLHFYLTVPFVLSWSVMNALACGTTVLASNTAPVQEMITHEKNGLLAEFFDIDEFVNQAERVLDNPKQYKELGESAREMIHEKYSLEVCLPKMLKMYEEV
jgi:glycosyltransferase involved in cell wall biosynthesis